MLCELMNTIHVYTVHMSLCFECGDAIEIRNGIMFDSYSGLPQK